MDAAHTWPKSAGLISDGSGHIPIDGTAAGGVIRANSDPCDSDPGARLVIRIGHLECGHIVYRPVIFQDGLPRDERSGAALFALALTFSGSSKASMARLRRV